MSNGRGDLRPSHLNRVTTSRGRVQRKINLSACEKQVENQKVCVQVVRSDFIYINNPALRGEK